MVGRLAQTGYIHLFSFWSDRVNLIDEDDGGRVLLRLLEGFAQITLRFAGHLGHDLRTIDEEEEGARLVRNSSCHQRFTGTRRSEHQDTARRLDTDGLEELRMAERQFHHLTNLGHLLSAATNIVVTNVIQV